MHYNNVRYPPYLMHHGIKGQKWGVRRYQYENGSYTPEGKKRYGSIGESDKGSKPESQTWNAKDASKLSDEELNRRNSRLQRERQYKDLTTPAWKKELTSTLKDAAKKIFVTTAVASVAAITAKMYKNQFDDWFNKGNQLKNEMVKNMKKTFVDIGASVIMQQEIAKY